MKKASTIGSLLILIIVLTGVLGLVSLSVHKRSKEIGIRKVLGASVPNILTLVSQEYAALMCISILFSIPLSYIFASQWLSGFAYRVELVWWMFALPVILLFLFIILAACGQATKKALSNPVDTLRYE